MGVIPQVFYESDRCKVYLWDGVTPDAPGEPLSCDTFTPREIQVEGEFIRASLDASCGGEFEKLMSMSIGGIARIYSEALKVRPRIDGAEGNKAKFYLVVRR